MQLRRPATAAANAFRLHCSASRRRFVPRPPAAAAPYVVRSVTDCKRTGRAVPVGATVSVSAAMTLGETMLARCSRQPALSSCRRPCFVDVLHSLYCCRYCCDISVSLLLFTVILCLSFVTSLAIVTDASRPTPRTSGNKLTDRSAFFAKVALKCEAASTNP